MEVLGDGYLSPLEKGSNGKTKPRSKCTKWRIRVNTTDGEKTQRFDGTYAQAKRELESFKAKLTINLSDMSFKDYASKWYERRETKGTYAPSTLEKDRGLVKVLVKHFKNIKLADIDRATAVDGLLDIKKTSGYTSSYHNELHFRLKTILESARKDGLIPSNPLQDEEAPKIVRKQRRALTVDEFKMFLTRLSIEPMTAHITAVYIATLTGARRGELCGFTWADIDLENHLMYVRRSIMENGRAKDPKTAAGKRCYPIMSELAEYLKRWQRVQEELLRAIHVKQTLDTPVVNNDLGAVMNPQNLDRWWRKHRAEYGVDGLVLHELRHTYLTMLANSGAPSRVVQDVAGWSTIAEADTYVHADMSASQRAVDALEKNLGF